MMIGNLRREFKGTIWLSLVLAWVDFKTRNEGSYLGVFWYLLNPLLMFGLLLVIFSQSFGQTIPLYPAYLLLGLITFNFFQQVTNESVGVMLANGDLIKSVRFPYQALVWSITFRSLFSHLFEVFLFIALLTLSGANLTGLIFYPVILFFYLLFTLGVSLLLAVSTVYVIDFNNIWRFFSFLLWLATPIFYPASNYGQFSQIINDFNPLARFLVLFRDLVLSARVPSLGSMSITITMAISVFIIGILVFSKLRYKLMERI